jgi:hypothetical protein
VQHKSLHVTHPTNPIKEIHHVGIIGSTIFKLFTATAYQGRSDFFDVTNVMTCRAMGHFLLHPADFTSSRPTEDLGEK